MPAITARRRLSDLARDDEGLSSLKGALIAMIVGVVLSGLALAQRTGPAASHPEICATATCAPAR